MTRFESIELARFRDQVEQWPREGEHVLAQYDDETIVVYQAFRPEIAETAVRLQRFGCGFRLTRMSWIKPNFLWMMFRSGWAQKPDQERVLAIRIPRLRFEELLQDAVPSSFRGDDEQARQRWKDQVQTSEVRLQWDPDHHPDGSPAERRAIQLGLRGDRLRDYAHEWPIEVVDMTPFVIAQREHILDLDALWTPKESVLAIG